MRNYKLIYITFAILFLVGCATIEDQLAETEIVTNEAFEAGPKGVNIEEDEFTYFLPDSIEPESSDEFNIILTEGNQAYILFVNAFEEKTSRILYESSLLDEQYLLNKTYENEDSFGFILVYEIEEEQYEVVVGVGGTKLTTVTDKSKIAESAEKMMLIANSVRLKP
ncbi:hypothetical protein JOC85_001263 [Bacillus mesophilus]|uniref:Uncharacterized protein n=1 Tax=Bacillus mesophilus TaxID=1808955 RepID=A0A6M0QA69_9BACI|nr:hypothetical protein [Bacillus mesophilus]MBM7660491.1 hypothetical protein [Bacillus mesophilus]NEY71958.1 hypothetical protein [Bacillus mesophilus]